MGILDDAIREHLELKRAHGASEADIRHKEAEVFGPVRQEVAAEAAPAADEPVADAAVLEATDAADLQPTEVADLPPTEATAPLVEEPVADADHPAPAPEDPYAVHPGDHAVPDPHEEGEPVGKDPAWGEDTDFFSEPAAPPQPAAQVQHDVEERHPALHDTDEHLRPEQHAPEPVFRDPPPVEEPEPEPAPVEEPPVEDAPVEGAEDEDVLEETPEFLQDAPEHDRLWFEQKPPRDFDFGE